MYLSFPLISTYTYWLDQHLLLHTPSAAELAIGSCWLQAPPLPPSPPPPPTTTSLVGRGVSLFFSDYPLWWWWSLISFTIGLYEVINISTNASLLQTTVGLPISVCRNFLRHANSPNLIPIFASHIKDSQQIVSTRRMFKKLGLKLSVRNT